MLKFDCGYRIMSECINLNSADYKKPNSGYFFIFLLCKCLWKVWPETNEFPTGGKQTSGNGEARNGDVYEL